MVNKPLIRPCRSSAVDSTMRFPKDRVGITPCLKTNSEFTDGWKIKAFLVAPGLFSGANLLLVSGRVQNNSNSLPNPLHLHQQASQNVYLSRKPPRHL